MGGHAIASDTVSDAKYLIQSTADQCAITNTWQGVAVMRLVSDVVSDTKHPIQSKADAVWRWYWSQLPSIKAWHLLNGATSGAVC